MNRSLGELESHARYAARGAGYQWGHAEEVGAAVRWLESFELPGATVLAMRLSRIDSSKVSQFHAAGIEPQQSGTTHSHCPIATGSALLDRANALPATIDLQHLEDPLLLVPTIHQLAALLQAPVNLTWQHDSGLARFHLRAPDICMYEGTTDTALATFTQHAEVTLEGSLHGGETLKQRLRANVADAVWDTLGSFATRTRAPATEESRRLGAGDSASS